MDKNSKKHLKLFMASRNNFEKPENLSLKAIIQKFIMNIS